MVGKYSLFLALIAVSSKLALAQDTPAEEVPAEEAPVAEGEGDVTAPDAAETGGDVISTEGEPAAAPVDGECAVAEDCNGEGTCQISVDSSPICADVEDERVCPDDRRCNTGDSDDLAISNFSCCPEGEECAPPSEENETSMCMPIQDTGADENEDGGPNVLETEPVDGETGEADNNAAGSVQAVAGMVTFVAAMMM
eukprot:TRINITY_DN32848_c0_g1_i1.p3 TRINITY_DN32848_c0_g1~~TRINITY_DN32848_c0_g1_i1.p3  ORF type:complete len:197 (+),score=51.17 TRINITY_DN32848_c0_g1_i1:181-771(+)